MDGFTPLEEAMEEARRKGVEEAVRLKRVDEKAAVLAFKQAKEWEKKLEELQVSGGWVGGLILSIHSFIHSFIHSPTD